jgi:hypothetical protein
VEFEKDSFVLVSFPVDAKNKLKMKWQGPFRIVKKATLTTEGGEVEHDNAYDILDIGTGKMSTVSTHRLKPFEYLEGQDLSMSRERDKNEWRVERIVNHAGDHTKRKIDMDFEVKWVGLDSSYNRWLPWNSLYGNELLYKYLAKNKQLAKLIPKKYRT